MLNTSELLSLAQEFGTPMYVIDESKLDENRKEIDRAFSMADVYVMPSVSEPFGIAPLEAISNDVPVIISKTSGVAEVLTHALKVDFWDTMEMANKILAVLKHPALHMTLRQHGNHEVKRFTWRDSARQCLEVYRSLMPVELSV